MLTYIQYVDFFKFLFFLIKKNATCQMRRSNTW